MEMVNKKRRREEAGKMTNTLCRAQVDSLRKTVQFIRAYILTA